MSNSSLVTYTRISSHHNKMTNKKNDTITIHCAVGQLTAKGICDYFCTTEKEVSSNYTIGYDGSIALCVEEKDRAWTSGGSYNVNGETGYKNDHHAITIEVASDKTSPYAITDKAYNALIELVADICKRNDIKKLLWKGDKTLVGQLDKQNMTVHRWFGATVCPGDYLYERMGDIADKVNAILNPVQPEPKTIYRVQVGAYTVKANAEAQLKKLKAAGYTDAFIAEVEQ